MAGQTVEEKERLLGELKEATANQRIADLDRIAKAFGCRTSERKSGHKFYIPPYKDMEIVNVAPPHSDTVKKKYVTRFISMCEEILERELEQRR